MPCQLIFLVQVFLFLRYLFFVPILLPKRKNSYLKVIFNFEGLLFYNPVEKLKHALGFPLP